MKKLLTLLTFIAVSAFFQGQAQTLNIDKANSELDRRGEMYFSFIPSGPAQIADLTGIISISSFDGNKILAYANRNEFTEFLKLGLDYTVLTAPSELISVQMTDDIRQVLTWNYYPTYPAYESIMQQFATDHPDICKLLTITTLASGRKILGLRITDNVDVQEDEPEFLYISSIHGDETTGYILMLHLADYLLSGYGTDSRITNMVNNFDIVICPLANPDGTYKGGNNTVNGATRGNANNVDFNRNFPDPKKGPHPDGNAWQPETVAFMNFAGFNSFTMSANFHGGTEVVNYPWDTWSKLTADDAWWYYVSREYADTVHQNAPASYMNFMNNGVTNGYAWYEINGGHQDYMNYFRNCRECTIEISDTKLLPENQLLTHWKYNYRSFLNYIEESGYGLRGIVTDSLTGAPLNAKIFISGFDKDSSQVYTDPQVGDYHRLLKGGTYTVTYSAAGYYPKSYTVQVADKQTLVQNVQLYNGALVAGFTSDTRIAAVDQPVTFSDLTAGSPQTWKWTFIGGTPAESDLKNPVVSYSQPGSYPVKLVVSRTGISDSLMINNYVEVKPWYLMSNKVYTVCDGRFFDSGGPAAGYSANEDKVITFYPADNTRKLTVLFNEMAIEGNGTACDNDRLSIYDGTGTSDPLLATLCGTSLHSKITAANPAGALTFRFESNSSNELSGWDISVSCDSNVGINENPAALLRIFPNPVFNGKMMIESDQQIDGMCIRDITGKVRFTTRQASRSASIDCSGWPSGIYLLQLSIQGEWINRKIQVISN
jgi:PKD repeat protein